MADLVLIHKHGRGFYRDHAQGYADLDGAGLFTREDAKWLCRAEEATLRIVELDEVETRAQLARAGLLKRVACCDRIIAAAAEAARAVVGDAALAEDVRDAEAGAVRW